MSEKIETKDVFESEEIFRVLFEYSPDAIFLVDPHDPNMKWPILLCNEAASHMHGYDKKEILLHQSLNVLWARTQDLTFAIDDDYRSGKTTRDALHCKKGGAFFPVSYFYTPVHLKNMDLLMIIVRDMTDVKRLQEVYEEVRKAEEKFQAIFENSPDGIVIIAPSDSIKDPWPWLIEDCNKEFCKMNGFDRVELIGKDIRTISSETPFDDSAQEKFERLEEWPTRGNEAIRRQYYQRLKQGRIQKNESHRRKDGTTFIVEASLCLASLGDKEYVLGIDRDITEQEHLRRYLEDLQIDVGRTFHTFSSTLFQMRLVLTPTIKALGSDPFRKGYAPTTSEIWQAVVGPWKSLVTVLRKLLNEVKSDTQKDMSSSADWDELDNLFSHLTGLEHIEIVEYRVPILQRVSRQVIDAIDRIQQQHTIRKDLLREVKFCAEQLERMACLVMLKRVQDRVIETDWLVRDIRERVLTGNKTEKKAGVYEFWSLVAEAQKGLAEYAAYKGITFKENDLSNGARVKVVKPHIVRALNNLLDNAIKYSWWRDTNVQPWIGIRCYTTHTVKEDRVYVEIEDYGVPIPRSEIEQELIFKLGYRGRLSGQLNRPGTGIGLFDARAVAKRYGGDVMLDSHPASQFASPDDLKVPHLKTAILYLPIHRR